MTNVQAFSSERLILIYDHLEGRKSKQFAASEPAFLLDESNRLSPFIGGLKKDLADSLAHAVAASPVDLLQHTRRVFHSYEHDAGDGLYAALLDLFLILRERGRDLRQRLLNGARDRLKPECYRALALRLAEGSPSQEGDFPAARGSVLTQGSEGSLELVRISRISGSLERDALIEAREHIEYSQLDQARELLEAAVLEQPEREDLQFELLALYRATRDDPSMQGKLEQLLEALPEGWQAPEPKGGDES